MSKKFLGRVNRLIQQKVAKLLLEQSHDSRLSDVTITDVSVNRDTTRAEIYYSIIGSDADVAEVQEALVGAAGWLRGEIAPTLRLRNIPELVFIHDMSLETGERIDQLLDAWREEKEDDDRIPEEDAAGDSAS
ncbi:MAG: 30S ribosome-binding factor RbfA [Anaerolineales bacterium]